VDRPPHLVQIPTDLANWIEQQEQAAEVRAEEMDAAPQVTRVQRRADDRENEEWEIGRIVERKESRDGSRCYRVRYAGYSNPEEDRWYDEDDLRGMGQETSKMLDDFDAAKDAEEIQQRLATREQGGTTRRSARERKVSRK
jgi:hypothetical protein